MKVKGLTETRRNESQRDSWKKNKDVISYSFITVFFYISIFIVYKPNQYKINASQYEPTRANTSQYESIQINTRSTRHTRCTRYTGYTGYTRYTEKLNATRNKNVQSIQLMVWRYRSPNELSRLHFLAARRKRHYPRHRGHGIGYRIGSPSSNKSTE